MKLGPLDDNSASVPIARQAGTESSPDADLVSALRSWIRTPVWTERMLEALARGIEGGVWFSLSDKVLDRRNLYLAADLVLLNEGAAGVDHQTVEHFGDRYGDEVRALEKQLRDGSYRPQPVRRVWIPKPGTADKRPLGIPTVRDRVVQQALRMVLEPIFESGFAAHSYGFRPNRGCKDALRRVDQLLKEGYGYVVDADLKSYFDTIPHDQLMARLREKVADGRVLAWVEMFLKQGIMDGLQEWKPEQGSPQGAVISPLLSNIYLDPLDRQMADAGFQMVRYADDFVILCKSREEAEQALAAVTAWTTEAGLTLHPTKTKIVDAFAVGFDFLGYRFCKGRRWPRPKSLQKFKDTIREKTRPQNGRSIECIIADVNATLRGWFAYFQHSHRWLFEPLDQWVRRRLRTVLRRYTGRPGRGWGSDHQRWPNAYFKRAGLFNLKAAWQRAVQSAMR